MDDAVTPHGWAACVWLTPSRPMARAGMLMAELQRAALREQVHRQGDERLTRREPDSRSWDRRRGVPVTTTTI